MFSRLMKKMTEDGGPQSSFFLQMPVVIMFVIIYGAFSSFYKIGEYC